MIKNVLSQSWVNESLDQKSWALGSFSIIFLGSREKTTGRGRFITVHKDGEGSTPVHLGGTQLRIHHHHVPSPCSMTRELTERESLDRGPLDREPGLYA